MHNYIKAFEVEFFAQGKEFTAKVHKIPSDATSPVEYHVFNIRPELPQAPRAFMFKYNKEEDSFESTIFNNDAELSQNMFSSIERYCLEHDTPLV